MAVGGNLTLCLEKNLGCSEFVVNKFRGQDTRIPNSEAQQGESFGVFSIDRIVLTRLSVNVMGSAGPVLSKYCDVLMISLFTFWSSDKWSKTERSMILKNNMDSRLQINRKLRMRLLAETVVFLPFPKSLQPGAKKSWVTTSVNARRLVR